jgi:hypothetical protein
MESKSQGGQSTMNSTKTSIVRFDNDMLAVVTDAMYTSPVAEHTLFFQTAGRLKRSETVTEIRLTEKQWNTVIDRLLDVGEADIANYVWVTF